MCIRDRSRQVLEHPEDATRPPSRAARQPGYQLPYEDVDAARVREASAGRRVGRELFGRSHKRHLLATHLLLAESTLFALLPAAFGPVQGEGAQRSGDGRSPGLEIDARIVD